MQMQIQQEDPLARMKLARQEKQAIMDGLTLWGITKHIPKLILPTTKSVKNLMRYTRLIPRPTTQACRNYHLRKKHLSGILLANQKIFLGGDRATLIQWQALIF